MLGSHHLLIPLGSSNLSSHYTPVYLCPSFTSSMQPHLLTKENRTTGSFTLCVVLLNLATAHMHTPHTTFINKCIQINKQERDTRLRLTYYSQGTNHDPLSGRKHLSHKQVNNITTVIITI